MSQYPTPGGGPNQTLLELILALKGLAQTFDLAIDNLKTVIESEAKFNARELDRIRNDLGKNSQAMAVLPITLSDRVEKLIDGLEHDIDGKIEAMLREVQVSINQVQETFVRYIQSKGEAVPEELLEGRQVTGRVEVRRDGTVGIMFNTAWSKRLILGLKWLTVGSASYGAIELFRQFIL